MKTFVRGRNFKIGSTIWTFLGQPNSAEPKYQKWCFFDAHNQKRKCFSNAEMKGLDVIPL